MMRWTRGALVLVCAWVLAGCTNIVFSPDGKSIAFPWPEGDDAFIATVGIDGTGFRFLAGSRDHEPAAWSPDGKRLLTTVKRESSEDLYLFNLEAQRSRKVLDRVTGPVVWAGSSNVLIAGQSGEPGTPDALVWLDLGSGKENYRIGVPAAGFRDPEEGVYLPSSDGIAFLGSDGNVHAVMRGVYTKITSTDDVVGLAANSKGNVLTWARRSRNPKYILLSLYRYDLDKRTVQKLPFPDRVPLVNPNPRKGPKEVALVRFSPNGSEMAVVCEADPVPGKEQAYPVYRMRLDGAGAIELGQLPDMPETGIWALAWSPDGSKLATLEARKDLAQLVLYGPARDRKVLRVLRTPPKKP